MNRNEQIEITDMALAIREATGRNIYVCEEEAKALIKMGYRKASEVEKETYDRMVDTLWKEVEGWKKNFESLYETAKATLRAEVASEIFAGLETKAPWFCENQTAYEHFNEEIAELKKKYTEVDENA